MLFIKQTILSLLLPGWHLLHRKHIVILMLHGVMDKESADSSWTPMRTQISPQQLDNALKVLAKKYTFISLAHAVDMLMGIKPIEPHCMVLTFDDGYRNNLTHALPILSKYRAPATIFLSTGHITQREPFWYDRMDYAIQRLPKNHEIQLDSRVIKFIQGNRLSLAAAFKELRYALKGNPDNYSNTLIKINEIVAELEDQAEQSLRDIFEADAWTSLMTWDEVETAVQQGVTFGSHTVDHVLLGKMEEDMIREQLIVSRETIEKYTGIQCQFLCYPDGSFSSQVCNIAEQCGYKSAVTIMEGLNCPGNVPLLSLYRNSFPNAERADSIFGVASGFYAYLQGNTDCAC